MRMRHSIRAIGVSNISGSTLLGVMDITSLSVSQTPSQKFEKCMMALMPDCDDGYTRRANLSGHRKLPTLPHLAKSN